MSGRGAKSHLVELWGYPGAGKTTVARAVSRAGLCHTHEMRADTANLSYHCKKERARAALAKVKAEQKSALEKFATQRSILFDEGVLNEIWRQLYRNPEFIAQDWWREHVADAAPRIILLDVAPHCARDRIRTKTQPGPINCELREAALEGAQWKRAIAAYEAIVHELLAQKADIRLVKNDDGSVYEPHEAVAAHLNSFV
ncbi:MAG: AAA family ATPase [Xanthobacteraceae bacterium]|nr:AAA family ATPase [Xanthobacteraceae bacterium]